MGIHLKKLRIKLAKKKIAYSSKITVKIMNAYMKYKTKNIT
tara:strand:- start:60 stop:182 length:123 start_codon:yes stop_codon:yes gene_type:complete